LQNGQLARWNLGNNKTDRCKTVWKAAREGNYERLKAAIDAGCDVEIRNEYGQTPLMLAGLHGNARYHRFEPIPSHRM